MPLRPRMASRAYGSASASMYRSPLEPLVNTDFIRIGMPVCVCVCVCVCVWVGG
jgi:hypothetical protein